jgi:N6-L-threonylcarbamoyladenine synthase
VSETITILAIESSCDDTSAAVLQNGNILANHVANQSVHEKFGGVVPELASRAHQQNILPVVEIALKEAGVKAPELDAIAYTRGPGLMGSLLVGGSFAKGLSISLNKPLLAVHHMEAHVMAHFIDDPVPDFPFLCLVVSGGHTQLVRMENIHKMEIIGKTKDDAAGEAFDKTAKLLGLPYPGGPLIDKLGAKGNPDKYSFSVARMPGYDFSFSGLKTGILYFLQAETKKNPDFIAENLEDICASVQKTIVGYLLSLLEKAATDLGISEIGIAGGVSANSYLRKGIEKLGKKQGWRVHIPSFEYCTDNAAMIAIAGYHKFLSGNFGTLEEKPFSR